MAPLCWALLFLCACTTFFSFPYYFHQTSFPSEDWHVFTCVTPSLTWPLIALSLLFTFQTAMTWHLFLCTSQSVLNYISVVADSSFSFSLSIGWLSSICSSFAMSYNVYWSCIEDKKYIYFAARVDIFEYLTWNCFFNALWKGCKQLLVLYNSLYQE